MYFQILAGCLEAFQNVLSNVKMTPCIGFEFSDSFWVKTTKTTLIFLTSGSLHLQSYQEPSYLLVRKDVTLEIFRLVCSYNVITCAKYSVPHMV